jgi:hypothetical protein
VAVALSLQLVRTARSLGPALAQQLRRLVPAAGATALALADALGRLFRGILGA